MFYIHFIYIPAALLAKTGFDPHGPPPLYRVWTGPRGRVVVQLYRATARDDQMQQERAHSAI